MLFKDCRVLIPFLFLGARRFLGTDPQNAILFETRMDVEMKMRNFLECRLADGVPETQSFVRKCRGDGPRHATKCCHEGRAARFVQLPHVMEVLTRDDECVAWMKLPKIDKGHGEVVRKYDAGRNPAVRNVAKDTLAALWVLHGQQDQDQC